MELELFELLENAERCECGEFATSIVKLVAKNPFEYFDVERDAICEHCLEYDKDITDNYNIVELEGANVELFDYCKEENVDLSIL